LKIGENRDISVTVRLIAAKFGAMPNFAAICQTVTEMSRFFDFQDGGSRRLRFSKNLKFNGRQGGKGQTASSRQILRRSIKPLPTYQHIINTTASIPIEFFTTTKTTNASQERSRHAHNTPRWWIALILKTEKSTAWRGQKAKLRHRAKFRGDRSNRYRDIAIFRLSVWRPSVIFNFEFRKKFLKIQDGRRPTS